jgi:hypothetical protein
MKNCQITHSFVNNGLVISFTIKLKTTIAIIISGYYALSFSYQSSLNIYIDIYIRPSNNLTNMIDRKIACLPLNVSFPLDVIHHPTLSTFTSTTINSSHRENFEIFPQRMKKLDDVMSRNDC